MGTVCHREEGTALEAVGAVAAAVWSCSLTPGKVREQRWHQKRGPQATPFLLTHRCRISRRVHYFPKQHHQLGSKCSNIRACGVHFISNCHSLFNWHIMSSASTSTVSQSESEDAIRPTVVVSESDYEVFPYHYSPSNMYLHKIYMVLTVTSHMQTFKAVRLWVCYIQTLSYSVRILESLWTWDLLGVLQILCNDYSLCH